MNKKRSSRNNLRFGSSLISYNCNETKENLFFNYIPFIRVKKNSINNLHINSSKPQKIITHYMRNV